jgi:hypothetical protein
MLLRTRINGLAVCAFVPGFATGDKTVADAACSPDLVEQQFGLAGSGAQAIEHVKAAIADVHRAVPDISFTIEDSAQQGDTIWVRVRARGTATGPFLRPTEWPPGRFHGARRRPRGGRSHRRALGRAGPLRDARPDRRARPAGLNVGLPAGVPTALLSRSLPLRLLGAETGRWCRPPQPVVSGAYGRGWRVVGLLIAR